MLTQEEQKQLQESLTTVVDEAMEKRLGEAISPLVAAETKKIVEKMRLDQALTGHDITGLSIEQKEQFAHLAKAVVFGKTKASEALIIEQDNRGGYLVPTEVANAIVRIAASVGLVLSQATKWPMGTDEKDIPAYTGAFLEGEYLGVDAQGTVTGINFGQARLIVKKWQLAFVIGNDLLADSAANLGEWLLALAGEALANRTDKEGLIGNGKPFVGVMNNTSVPMYTLPAGAKAFSDYRAMEDGAQVVGQLEESVLVQDAAWYMHRTLWAMIRSQKSATGDYILPMLGAAQNNVLTFNPQARTPLPVGEYLGYPVYTTRHLPSLSASAPSTPFMVFGSMKAMAYGDRGDISLDEFKSGAFAGKEIGLADQRAMVLKKRHALTLTLPQAFVIVKTAA
jgi:HK97 family phage major capsid protein